MHQYFSIWHQKRKYPHCILRMCHYPLTGNRCIFICHVGDDGREYRLTEATMDTTMLAHNFIAIKANAKGIIAALQGIGAIHEAQARGTENGVAYLSFEVNEEALRTYSSSKPEWELECTYLLMCYDAPTAHYCNQRKWYGLICSENRQDCDGVDAVVRDIERYSEEIDTACHCLGIEREQLMRLRRLIKRWQKRHHRWSFPAKAHMAQIRMYLKADAVNAEAMKPYTAYVNEMGQVLIDYGNTNFQYAHPYTTKHLTVLEKGVSQGGRTVVKIFARLQAMVNRRSAKAFELSMEYGPHGVTVYNKAEKDRTGAKIIAAISTQGKLRWYVKPGYIPSMDALHIREKADRIKSSHESRLAEQITEERIKVIKVCRLTKIEQCQLMGLHRGFCRWRKKHNGSPFPAREHASQIRSFLGVSEVDMVSLKGFCHRALDMEKCCNVDCADCPVSNIYAAFPENA